MDKYIIDGHTVHFTGEDIKKIQEAARKEDINLPKGIEDINLPEEKELGPNFLEYNPALESIDLPIVRPIENISLNDSDLTDAQRKQIEVDKIVDEMTEETGDKIMLPEEQVETKKIRGYGASWLLGVLTGAVSVGMLVLSSFLMK